MSIQEILGKDPKRWKYAECTEILNGNTTPEQKQTASDRQASIKAWLRSKEDQNKPIAPTQQSIVQGNDVSKLGFAPDVYEALEKGTTSKTRVLLAKYKIIEDELVKHNLNNPPTIGMFLKLLENCD